MADPRRLIQVRRPGLTKPLVPVTIDKRSPLSQGLTHCWLFEPGFGDADTFKGLVGTEKTVTFGSQITSADWTTKQTLGHGLAGGTVDINSRIDVGEEIDGEDITVAFWIVPEFAFNTGDRSGGLIGNADGAVSSGLVLQYRREADAWQFLIRRSGGLANIIGPTFTSDAELGRNTPQLIVAGSNSVGTFLDVNGVEEGSSAIGGTFTPASKNTFLMGNNGFVSSLNGPMHSAMIWNRVLSKAERRMLYYPNTRWSMLQNARPNFYYTPAAVVGGRIMSSLADAGGLAGRGGIAGQGGGLAG